MVWLVPESKLVPVADTIADCGGTGDEAGSAACVLVAPALLLVSVTKVLVFTEPPLSTVVLDAGIPEVASSPGGD